MSDWSDEGSDFCGDSDYGDYDYDYENDSEEWDEDQQEDGERNNAKRPPHFWESTNRQRRASFSESLDLREAQTRLKTYKNSCEEPFPWTDEELGIKKTIISKERSTRYEGTDKSLISYFHDRNYYIWSKDMENRFDVDSMIYKITLRKERNERERLQLEQEEEDSKISVQGEEKEENSSILSKEPREKGTRQKGKEKRRSKRRSGSKDSTPMNAEEPSTSNLNHLVVDGLDTVTSVGGTIGQFQTCLLTSQKKSTETWRMEVLPATNEENEK
jgi:hypothetical protein